MKRSSFFHIRRIGGGGKTERLNEVCLCVHRSDRKSRGGKLPVLEGSEGRGEGQHFSDLKGGKKVSTQFL